MLLVAANKVVGDYKIVHRNLIVIVIEIEIVVGACK